MVDDKPTLFTPENPRYIRSDGDIQEVLKAATNSRFDVRAEAGRSTFTWSVREFAVYEVEEASEPILGVTLARSVIARTGQTVTDSAIEDALSELSPSLADTTHLFFYMKRHLVAVEYNSAIMTTQLWRYSFQAILSQSAKSLELESTVQLEPVPREEEIITAFRSFARLTRVRVRLRVPNPELDRRTERLRKLMLDGGIRDYTQDMRNPNGLSKAEGELPFATVAMAQAGYKQGEVILTGYKDGRIRTIKTGNRAARGRLDGLKDYLRGIAAIAKAKETQAVVAAIMTEVDRIAEPAKPSESEQ